MPAYKLTRYIEYKANWLGIRVIKLKENGTSKICPECGAEGKRPYRGLFKCDGCGYRANADLVGARNILKRGLEYISELGAAVNRPLTGALTPEAPSVRVG
jgi:putative transposase